MKKLQSVKFFVTFSWPKIASVVFIGLSVTFARAAADLAPFFDGRIFPEPEEFLAEGGAGISEGSFTLEFGEDVKSASAIRALVEKRLAGLDNPAAVPVRVSFRTDAELAEEAYQIQCVRSGSGADPTELAVAVSGGGDRALCYAAASLVQLIDRENSELLTASVRDRPVWKERCVADFFLPQTERLAEFLALWKISEISVQTGNSWRDISPDAKMQWGSYPTVRAMLDDFSAWYENNGGLLDMMLSPRIYGPGGRNRIDCADDEQTSELAEHALFAAKRHVRHIMLRADDVVPEVDGKYQFTSRAEEERFRSLGEAHGHLVKKVAERVWSECPDTVISFCPGPYTIDAHQATRDPAREYLADLAEAMPPEAYIVWTGRDVVSPEITAEDAALYRELVHGHRTFLWHNTEFTAKSLALPRSLSFYPSLAQDCDGVFFANAEGVGKERNRPADLTFCAVAWEGETHDGGLDAFVEATFKLTGVDKSRYRSFLEKLIELETAPLSKPEKLALLISAEELAKGFEKSMDMRWFQGFRNVAFAALTAAVPEIPLPRGPLTVVPDGRLNEEVWTLRAEASELVNTDGSPTGKRALFYYNEVADALYIALEFDKTAELKFLPVGERTCNLALNADGELKTFYHWVIEWKPDVAVAVAPADGGGNVAELVIPVEAFRSATLPADHRTTPGEEWRLQIICDGERFFSAPNPNDPQDPGVYGTISF